jgi:4a-hydroxytetrahydrobiopterin dehydratase
MNIELSDKQCQACQGAVSPLTGSDLTELSQQLKSGWAIVAGKRLGKEYTFKDYEDGVKFTRQVATIAQEENHHPDILLCYGKVRVDVWTHKVDGLTEADFIFAAKTERAYTRNFG